MSSLILKIIAVTTMLCDHIGLLSIGTPAFILHWIGRMSFPIFAFQISEGYSHTQNLKKYFFRLFIFAIISQPIFYFFRYSLGYKSIILNIFFTLLLGLLSITIFDKCKNKAIGILGVILCIVLGKYLPVDYGYWGVLIIFAFYIFKKHKILLAFGFFILVILLFGKRIIFSNFYYYNIVTAIFTFLPIIPILLYNGKQGKKIKYLLYIFYPVHLLILGLIALLT